GAIHYGTPPGWAEPMLSEASASVSTNAAASRVIHDLDESNLSVGRALLEATRRRGVDSRACRMPLDVPPKRGEKLKNPLEFAGRFGQTLKSPATRIQYTLYHA
ncbi:MAG TPA: hypothetical protein VL069_14535, partial [Opitutus sp.]|nr:hypothetical protein [Opitutus sp.]